MTEAYPEPKRGPGRPPKPPAAPLEAESETVKILPMSSAPHDGKPLWLTANGATWVRAAWRSTRVMDYEKRRFVPAGFWVFQNTVRKIDFEPTGWSELHE